MRISDWSSDVCSSDLAIARRPVHRVARGRQRRGCARRLARPELEMFGRPGGAIGFALCGRRRAPFLRARDAREAEPEPGPDQAATIDRHLHLPLRSEEHTSELQSLMRISYAVFGLKNTHKVEPTDLTTLDQKPAINPTSKR